MNAFFLALVVEAMPGRISTFEHSEKNRFNGFSPFLCGIFLSFFVFIENQSFNDAGIFRSIYSGAFTLVHKS